jgi:SlyX protein
MSDTRITRLEEQHAHLTRSLEELNEVVTAQAGEIDLLTRRVHMLMERIAEEEQASGGTVSLGDQKPPHW